MNSQKLQIAFLIRSLPECYQTSLTPYERSRIEVDKRSCSKVKYILRQAGEEQRVSPESQYELLFVVRSSTLRLPIGNVLYKVLIVHWERSSTVSNLPDGSLSERKRNRLIHGFTILGILPDYNDARILAMRSSLSPGQARDGLR